MLGDEIFFTDLLGADGVHAYEHDFYRPSTDQELYSHNYALQSKLLGGGVHLISMIARVSF